MGAARLIAALGALVVAAALGVAFVPDMRWWGLDALRFAAPPAWILLALAALALVPGPAGRVAQFAAAAGDALTTRRTAALGFAALLGVAAWFLPDRGLVVGDALLRHGTLETAARAELLYPQALPLELLLHIHLPRFLADASVADPVTAARLLGAFEAALLGALATVFARALGLSGAAASIAVSGVVFGGWLGLFTGYAKAFSELTLVVLASATAGVRLVRDGKGALALGAAVAAGILLHRSAVALLPAFAFALFAFARGRPGANRGTVRGVAAAVGPVVLAAALAGPHILASATGIDRGATFASEDVARAGGPLAAAVAGQRLLDLLNLGLFFSPALGLGAIALLMRGRAALARPEFRVLLVLAIAHAGMSAVVHPAQGVFRDWDVFAPSAMALAALAGAALAYVLAEGPRRRGAASARPAGAHAGAVSAAVALPPAFALAWLVLAADGPRSLVRAEAFVAQPPPRTAVERAKTWDFLGAAYYRAGRPLDAARAFDAAAQTSSNARLFLQQARAAREGGDLPQAERAYRSALRTAADPAAAWQGLGSLAWARGDLEGALEAARALLALAPGDPARQRGLAAVERAVAERRAAADSLRRGR